MDLDLSAEHQLLRQTIRDFCAREVEPVIDEHERARRFPTDIVAMLGPMGLLGVPYPEDEGGAGLDTLAYAIAVEEFSRVWGSLGLIVAAHTSLACGPLHLAATAEQKERFLAPLAQGKVLGAFGLTEPEAGSDSGGTRTSARFEPDAAIDPERPGGSGAAGSGEGADGSGAAGLGADGSGSGAGASSSGAASSGCWVIDGRKRFITNAGQAGTYVVTARTGDRPDGSAEISAFIVPADSPGFSVGRLEEKMGLHSSATGELIFEGCRVPAANMLGERGAGWKLFLATLDGGRVSIGAMAVGLAQAALDAAVAYARERRQFGRPIGSFEGVAFMVADMATEVEAARQMVYRAAWLKDQGRDYALAAAQGKLFASEVSQRATNAAVQIHGGYGYVEEYKVERYLRDAKLTEIGEGTSQIQRLVIGRRVLGLPVA